MLRDICFVCGGGEFYKKDFLIEMRNFAIISCV